MYTGKSQEVNITREKAFRIRVCLTNVTLSGIILAGADGVQTFPNPINGMQSHEQSIIG